MENINDSNINKEERTPNKKNKKKNGKKNRTIHDEGSTENVGNYDSLNCNDKKGENSSNKLSERNERTKNNEENSKDILRVKSTNLNVKEKIKDEDEKHITNKDLKNSVEVNNINEKDNTIEKNKNIISSSSNAEIIVEPLAFEEKLKKWKGTEDSLKEKKEDERKLQEQRQLHLENVKLAHSLKKEEKILQQMYLEQLKKDEELAKQLEQELNAEVRKELNKIEQDDFKLATIIQNSLDSEPTQQNINLNNDQINTKKVSKVKLLKEKFKSFFKKKPSK